MDDSYRLPSVSVNRVKAILNWRRQYLELTLQEIKKNSLGEQTLLDIGAGQGQYRQLCSKIGFKYLAHDFAKWSPNQEDRNGDSQWNYTDLDYMCDITELPDNIADFAICTDVLEHVPDPCAAVVAAISSLKPGGEIIFLVPQNSIMHQSPYWFSPGYSPWFFAELARKHKSSFELRQIFVVGDYYDFLFEEVFRPLRLGRVIPENLLFPLRNKLASLFRVLFPWLRDASSLGVIAVFRKK